MAKNIKHNSKAFFQYIRGHSLRVKKRRIKMVASQGTFTQRVVNAWNGLPEKVVAAEKVHKFKLELDRYLEVMEIEGYRDVDRILDRLSIDG